jgi:Ca2+-binding RTX toxin-like protein
MDAVLVLIGGAGAGIMNGGNGNDVLIGGPGLDNKLDGRLGSNVVIQKGFRANLNAAGPAKRGGLLPVK